MALNHGPTILQDGARSVNLTTGDQPADVYAGIAERYASV